MTKALMQSSRNVASTTKIERTRARDGLFEGKGEGKQLEAKRDWPVDWQKCGNGSKSNLFYETVYHCFAVLNQFEMAMRSVASLRPIIRSGTRCFTQNAAGNLPPRPDSETAPPPLTQLSEEEIAFKDTVKRFSNDVVKPLVRQMDANSHMEKVVIDGCFENGFMGIEIPAKYDGPDSSFFNTVIVVEELAKVDPSVSVFCDVQNTLVAPLIIELGTEEQKQKYLTRIHKDWVGSFALSEVSSGSDAFALKTTAKADGDDFILNGSKMWITNGEHASFYLVMANAEPEKGYRGITCFLVDRDAKGLSLGKKEDKLGIRASSTVPVHLDNVRVHKSAILGEYGKAYKYAIECLNAGRIGIGAQMVGLAQGALDVTIPYLQERKQFGSRIIDFQWRHDFENFGSRYIGDASIIATMEFWASPSFAGRVGDSIAETLNKAPLDITLIRFVGRLNCADDIASDFIFDATLDFTGLFDTAFDLMRIIDATFVYNCKNRAVPKLTLGFGRPSAVCGPGFTQIR
uniref:Short/branched chain specific acyl-CoA dehydrogenase, mitochondrial n=1 Tax=Panagrellus redivivus TaxID=6233 RepID=A0A7E4V999_PANRE